MHLKYASGALVTKIRETVEKQTAKEFDLHFIPTSSSWLNLVERFFGLLTKKQLRRGVFISVKELECCIMKFIQSHNKDKKPFEWTKSAEEILAKVERAKQAVSYQRIV